MTPETASIRRTRTLVFAIGGLLWAAVIVAGALLWKGRTPNDGPSPKAPSEASSATGALTASASTLDAAASEPEWDSAGVKDFSFTERSGRTITKVDLLGRPWIVSFIFTHCAGPCPMVSTQMHQLQRQLKDTDVRLVSITVDPKRDTVEVLKKYADQYKADPERWLFLTGDQDEIYRLIGDSFQMPVKEITGPDRIPGWEIMHSTNILLVDAEGRVKAKYGATNGESMAKLRRDLKIEDKAKIDDEPTAPSVETKPAAAEEPASRTPAVAPRPDAR